MNIVLHIDKLVMEGFPISAAQLPIVRAALEAELVRLFSAPGGNRLGQARSEESLVAKPFHYRPEQGPARIGHQVARAVHSKLGSPG